MSFFSTSFCFFPCAAITVAFQVNHPAEHIQVHKDEIVSGIKQFIAVSTFTQDVAQQGCKIEQQLQDEHDGKETACPHGDEHGVDNQQ